MGFFNSINNITNSAATSGVGNTSSSGFAGGFYDPIIGQQQQAVSNPIQKGINAFAIARQRISQQQQQKHMRSQAPINPKGFTNQANIAGVYGQAVPGTFNRTFNSPLAQTMDPSLAMQVDPTSPGMPVAIQNDMASTGFPDYSQPQQPPLGVQTPISPTYDLNNQ
jgi:hypothetical protein